MTTNVWEEHDHHDHQGGGLGAHDESLVGVSDEVVLSEEEPSGEPQKAKGTNFRMLFIVFAVVAVSVSGFFFFKMIQRPAAVDQDVSYAPPPESPPATQGYAVPLQPEAPQMPGMAADPVAAQQVEPASDGVANIAAMSAQMTAALGQDASTAPQSAVVPPDAQPAAQIIPDRSAEIGQLQEQVATLKTQLKNSQEDLKAANSKPAPVAASAQPKPNPPAQKTAQLAPTKPGNPPSGGVARARNKPVITEARDTTLNDVSIRAIYPVSGKNPQAWVMVGDSLVEVSVGGEINGAKVRRINPEAMEIVTDSGVIRARR